MWLGIILAAFGFRIEQLGARSLWYDEGYTVQFAQYSVSSLFVDAAQLELNTPLHYVILHNWMRAAGDTEFSVRLLSVFAGTLSAVFIGQCLRELQIAKPGQWLGSALVALSPVCIGASQEVRMYAMLICLCCCSQWLWLRYCRTRQLKTGWLWCAISLLAFATHVLAALVFAAQACITLILALQKFRYSKQWQLSQSTITILLVCGAAMAGWTGFIVSFHNDYGTSFTDKLALWPTLIHSLAALLLPQTQPESWVPAIAMGVAAILAATFIIRGTSALQSAGVTLLSLIFIAAFCAITGKFAARYASITAPFLFIALSQTISPKPGSPAYARFPERPFSQSLSIGLSCISLIAMAISMQWWRGNPIYQQEDYRRVAAYLQSHLLPNETILLVSGHQAPVFSYYFGPNNWHALPPDLVLNVRHALDYASASQLLNTAVSAKQGVWLLLWQEDVIDPTFVVQGLLRRQANKLLPDVDTQEFHGLRLMHFTFDQPYQPTPEQFPPTSTSRIELPNPFVGLKGVGCHQFRPVTAGSSLMEIACFWQLEKWAALPSDLKVSLRIVNDSGQRVAQADQNLGQPHGLPYFAYDKVMTSFYFIPIPEDLKSGAYEFQAIPYSPAGEIGSQIYTPVVISQP